MSHDSAIFGSGVIIPPKVNMTITDSTEGIMHPNVSQSVMLAGLFTVPYFCRSFSINLSMGDNTCLR